MKELERESALQLAQHKVETETLTTDLEAQIANLQRELKQAGELAESSENKLRRELDNVRTLKESSEASDAVQKMQKERISQLEIQLSELTKQLDLVKAKTSEEVDQLKSSLGSSEQERQELEETLSRTKQATAKLNKELTELESKVKFNITSRTDLMWFLLN